MDEKIDKILKAELICPTILSVVSCKEPEQGLFDLEKQIEAKIEQDIFDELEKIPVQHRKDFHLFDLKFIDVTNSNNFFSLTKFLLLNGDIIGPQHTGRVKGNVKYLISEESYELAKQIVETNSQMEKDGYFNENFAYQRYGDSLKILIQILNDSTTQLNSVFDVEKEFFIYERKDASVADELENGQ